MIKAIVFDWGGVIAPNPNGGWLGVLADMLDSTIQDLLPHWQAARYEDLSRGIIDETEFLRLFEISFGRPLPDDVSKIWIEGSALHPWPEMLTYIQTLKDRGLKVALLSNTVRPMSITAKERGLYDGFKPLILSDVTGLIKPEHAIYEQMLSELHLNGNECIYVDDLPKDLVPAEELGMSTILASDDPNRTIALIEQVLNI